MKKTHNDLSFAIHTTFASLVKLYQELEKKPRRYGTDELLTSAEIHLIEHIGDNNEHLSVTDLAGIVGVTKGAVSQHLKKLEKKGLTGKEEDPNNSSRSIVKLTAKGRAAYYSHIYWHEQIDGGYLAFLASVEGDQAEFLLEFMSKAETFLRTALGADSKSP